MIDNKKNRFHIGEFAPNSPYALNIIPLLDSLGWKGSNIDLLEALVNNADNMNLEGFLKTMANLRFEGKVVTYDKKSKVMEDYPLLCVSKRSVYTVIKKDDAGYQVYNSNTQEYSTIKSFPIFSTFLRFTPLDNERFSLLKPQKDWFGQLLFRFRKEFIFIIFLSLLMVVFSFITPLFIMLIHSQLRVIDSYESVYHLGLAIFIFIVALNGIKGFRRSLILHVSTRIGNIISTEVFRRLLYLSPSYTESATVEHQTNRIRDFETIKTFFAGNAFSSMIDAPLSLLLLVGLSFIAGPLVFIPLLAVIVYGFIGVYFYRNYKSVTKQGSKSSQKKAEVLNEMLTRMKLIRSSGKSSLWFKRFEKSRNHSIYYKMRSSNYLNLINTTSKTISSITLIVSISWAVTMVMAGEMTGGALFASFLIISRAMSPISSAFSVFSQYSQYQKSVLQLNRLMALSYEVRPLTLVRLSKQLEGAIVFKNVFLKYSKDFAPALVNINFQVKENETIVILGHGGSGKSSILKLIMGMYSPLSGAILIDNINLKQFDLIRYRKSISYVPTYNYLFEGTIKSNLFIIKPDANKNEIENALSVTGLTEIIKELPYGIDTDVNSLKDHPDRIYFIQMISFARAIVRNAPICLIDEMYKGFTSFQIERIFKVIEVLKKSSTVLLITNDKSLLSLADKSILVDNGRIIKEGDPLMVYKSYVEGFSKL